ncbi:RNA polymerase sigma factor [Paenibacillus antarcticus]|uniref:RNA polymerase subunit sigma-24 n=1 Tax=Paenibacillus antarcticus TaxID=253703 RepID=A0A168NFH0_9BACL|nr:sigma-70 family RNA polymerase sigma factor [Paenibacillus antarcticus]OAB45742.1 RNA polymerase subunit sigma-24 [Paenibacillus antarcticus]
MKEPIEDSQIMQRIRDRDQAALELLYDRYERVVYSFAYRIVNDAMAAEEVVQELFLRIWNHGERYEVTQGKLTTWMFVITRNIAVDMLRRKSVRAKETPIETEVLQQFTDETSDTELEVQRRAESDEVKQALNVLNEEQKHVIEWIYFEGLTQQEVADRHDIPLGTVKSRVRLAMKQLKRRLTNAGRREHVHE